MRGKSGWAVCLPAHALSNSEVKLKQQGLTYAFLKPAKLVGSATILCIRRQQAEEAKCTTGTVGEDIAM